MPAGVPNPEVLAALAAIKSGATPGDLESETLDFKQPITRSRDDTAKMMAATSICFANAGGGSAVLGVQDKAPGQAAFLGTDIDAAWLRNRIHGLTRPSLLVHVFEWDHVGTRVVIVAVPEGVEIHADTQGRATRRVGTSCETLLPEAWHRLREDRQGFDWSRQRSGRSVGEIEEAAVDSVRRRLARFTDTRSEMARSTPPDLMRDLGVVTPEGELLRAGEVLFCEPSDPPLHYQYRNTPGGEVAHDYRSVVPGLIAFDEVIRRANQRGNAIPILMRDGQQIEVRDFPELAVREALVNAVAHRDYRLEGTVSIEHSPQLFTIQSPGPLVAGVSIENILTHPSKPRNALLAGVVHQLGLAERSGRGVDRIYREMIRAGKRPPVFEAGPLDTRVSLAGGAPNKRFATYVANLPDDEQEDVDAMLILFALTQSKRVDASALAPLLQRNAETTEMILRRLASDEVGMIAPSARTARMVRPKYYLRPEALRALGPALAYRAEGHDVIEAKIIQLVEALGTVENKAIQISCDVDVQTASNKLRELAQRGVLEKLGSQERGPGIKYGPGRQFPTKVSRRARRQG